MPSCLVKPKISDPLEEAPQLTAECIICYEEKHLMQQPEGCECTNKNYCFDCFIRTVIAQPIILVPVVKNIVHYLLHHFHENKQKILHLIFVLHINYSTIDGSLET